MFARIRGWFDGAAWFVAGAGVLFFVALLVAFLVLQSGSALLWTGQAVTGTERQGIAYYSWQGQSYTVDVPGNGSAKSITLYLDPGNPSNAIPDNTGNRVADVLGVGVPFAAGVVVLVIGGTRNYRWKRRNVKRGETDWWMSRVPPGGTDLTRLSPSWIPPCPSGVQLRLARPANGGCSRLYLPICLNFG